MNRNELVKLKPPFILLGLLITATLVHCVTPLRGIYLLQNSIVGGIFLCLGVATLITARGLLKKSNTSLNPAEQPKTFVITGPYKFTRNPIYVAGCFLIVGIAFMIGTLPFFAVLVVMFIVLNMIHIPYEEEQLQKVFGKDYHEYKKRVRRWF